MCVIAVVRGNRPTADQVRAMHETNAHGGGVAWRKDDTTIQWRKGLNLEEMQEECATLPIPYVAHFRLPSSDTSKDMDVCHPFPLEDGISTDLDGESKNGVLFHNGHWHDWKKQIWTVAAGRGIKLPDGEWSDTRAIAFAAHYMGEFALELIDEKVALFLPNGDINLFGDNGHAGWSKVAGADKAVVDLVVSNTFWERKTVTGFRPDDRRLPNRYQNIHSPNPLPATALQVRQDIANEKEESAPFWQGGVEEIVIAADAIGILAELEDWRGEHLISSGQFKKTKGALTKRLKELQRVN